MLGNSKPALLVSALLGTVVVLMPGPVAASTTERSGGKGRGVPVRGVNRPSKGASSSTKSRLTVTLNQAVGQADPTAGAPVHFTAAFSTSVQGFTSSGVTVGGTAGGTKTAVVRDSGNHMIFDVAVGGMTSYGTVSVTIPAGAARDKKGNRNAASSSTDNTISFGSAVGTSSTPAATTTTPTPTPTATTQSPQGTLLVGLTGDLSGWAGDSWDLATDLGVKVVREEIYGRPAANIRHTIDWAASRGVRVIGLTYHELGTSDVNAWPQITTWEVDNEPYWRRQPDGVGEDVVLGRPGDQGGPSKCANPPPSSRTGSTTATTAYGGETKSWLDWLAQGCPAIYDLADGFCVHPYGSPASGDLADVDRVHERVVEQRGSNKPFYVTEIGWHTTSTQDRAYATEAEQAADIDSVRRRCPAAFMDRRRLRLHAPRQSRRSEQRSVRYGLIRLDGSYKPVFAALQAATK